MPKDLACCQVKFYYHDKTKASVSFPPRDANKTEVIDQTHTIYTW
jgi:hypothetical protein